MKDSTMSDISDLFQELIVSKIKDEIEVLKTEIESVKDSNEEIRGIVEHLPKNSKAKEIAKEETTQVIDLISNCAEKIKDQLDNNQQAINQKCDDLKAAIGLNDKVINNLDSIQESIKGIKQNTDAANKDVNTVLDMVKYEPEIIKLLGRIGGNIGNDEYDIETGWSIKKGLFDINKGIEELSKKEEMQKEMMDQLNNKYHDYEKSNTKSIKILIVGNIVSIMGVIGLLLAHIF